MKPHGPRCHLPESNRRHQDPEILLNSNAPRFAFSLLRFRLTWNVQRYNSANKRQIFHENVSSERISFGVKFFFLRKMRFFYRFGRSIEKVSRRSPKLMDIRAFDKEERRYCRTLDIDLVLLKSRHYPNCSWAKKNQSQTIWFVIFHFDFTRSAILWSWTLKISVFSKLERANSVRAMLNKTFGSFEHDSASFWRVFKHAETRKEKKTNGETSFWRIFTVVLFCFVFLFSSTGEFFILFRKKQRLFVRLNRCIVFFSHFFRRKLCLQISRRKWNLTVNFAVFFFVSWRRIRWCFSWNRISKDMQIVTSTTFRTFTELRQTFE